MSREKPYRSKAPANLFLCMQEALASTFFLVQETGPTNFVLKDDEQKIFKVKLGGTHSCTCGGGRQEHCLHTLYVLLKIFRVLPDNPISWQLSFIDSEINWLLRNRAAPIVPVNKPVARRDTVCRISLKEEYACSICQEEMKQQESLVFCKVSCGHNFHAKCMKIWGDHRSAKGDKVTCPLCRTDWGPHAMSDIRKMALKVIKQPKVHNSAVCARCGMTPIRGERYRCLSCENTDLCHRCRDDHNAHYLLVKPSERDPWKSGNKPVDLQGLLHRELRDDDYSDLLELDEMPPLAEFILKATNDGVYGICSICNTSKPCKFKSFTCGHSAHEDCLLTALREEKYICLVDKQPILPGLSIFDRGHAYESIIMRRRSGNHKQAQRGQLFIGGTGIGIAQHGPVRTRSDIRVRKVLSRPLPVPDLIITGFQNVIRARK